jgi:hypothetical protein
MEAIEDLLGLWKPMSGRGGGGSSEKDSLGVEVGIILIGVVDKLSPFSSTDPLEGAEVD